MLIVTHITFTHFSPINNIGIGYVYMCIFYTKDFNYQSTVMYMLKHSDIGRFIPIRPIIPPSNTLFLWQYFHTPSFYATLNDGTIAHIELRCPKLH